MRSRCHSSVRSTCSASGGLPRHSAGRPSSPITARSGMQRPARRRSRSVSSGSSPRQQARRASARRSCRRWPQSPAARDQPGQPELARQRLQPVVGRVEVAHRGAVVGRGSGRQRHRLRRGLVGSRSSSGSSAKPCRVALQALHERRRARCSVAACAAHQSAASARRQPHAAGQRAARGLGLLAQRRQVRLRALPAPRPPGPAVPPHGRRCSACARRLRARRWSCAACRCPSCRPGCAPARSCRRRRRPRRSRCSARSRAASRRPRRRG